MSFREPLEHCDRLPLTLSVFRKNFLRISDIGPHPSFSSQSPSPLRLCQWPVPVLGCKYEFDIGIEILRRGVL